jgi:hypothetical protein
MAVQVARRQYATHPGASPAMAGPDGSGARAGSLQRGATGSLEPLILALAQAVDRSHPDDAKKPQARPRGSACTNED